MAAPLVPAPANNLGFLALYNQIPPNQQYQIEYRVYQEISQTSPNSLATYAHNFGFNYIQNLSRASYAALSNGLQNAIEAELILAQGPQAATIPNWVQTFLMNNLP